MMMKRIILLALIIFGVATGHSQILTFDFNGLAGNEASANSNSNHIDLNNSTISRGAGLTASPNGDRFNATNWAVTSIDNAVSGNDYMEFTITPKAGHQFSVSSIVVQWQRSGTGNTAIALRSSVDGYSTNLDAIKSVTDNTDTQTFTWTFTQTNSSSPVTYRFYSYAEAATGTGGPGDGSGNDIVVNGTVTPISSGTSTIAAGAGAEPGTISSLTNTQGAASLNFDIDIQDDGSTPGTDALDTKITQMVFAQGTGNDISDWTKVIAGAELTDGTNTMTGTVAANTITFSSINPATLGLIADNTTKNYILKVWLKTDFGTEKTTADGKNLVFRIQNTNITVDNTGSGFATGQDQNSGSSNNAIDVVATVLAYLQNATNVNTNASMTAVTLSANDANGNRDLAWATPVTISSTGTLTGDPVTGSLSSGVATFSTLTHTVAQTGRQLTASSTGLTSATSALFDVNNASSATDHFRSKGTGNWNAVGTWESSADGMTWINATLTPNNNANTITVLSPNTVTIPADVTIDQVTIKSGAMVDVTGGTLTVADGTGDDMVVNGTLKLSQPASITTTGNIVFKSGGLYQHNIQNTTTRIPSSTWETGSTCEVIGYTSGAAMANAGYDQNFYNFTWNCPSQTSELNLAGKLTNIAGDFTVTHTGSSNLRLIGSATTITVSGNLNIGTNGVLNMSGSNSKATINVSGNVNIQGKLTELGTASGLIHFVGTNQTLTAINNNSIENSVDFEVDCSSVTLMSNVALPANLKLTSGWLTLGNYDLDMSSSNTSITGGSTTSYIKTNGTGVLKRTVGNADVSYPVGNAAYNPAILKNAGTSDIYSLRVADDVFTNGDSGPALTEKVVDRTWYITEANTGGSNVEATFQWAESDELSGFVRSLCNVAHYTGGTWNEGTNGAASGSGPGPYTRKRTGITTFSPFAVIGQGALPVELSYFRALKSGNTALLEWQTLSELNNAYFGIERSNDGINYHELVQMAGTGNSNTAINYHYTDTHPAPGINYYRLRQVDTDGRYSYSPVRSLSYGSAKDFSVIPTIAHSDIRIELSSPVETDARIELIEVSTGRLLQTVTLESGTDSHTIAVSHLPAGMYFIKLQNGHELTTKRFVVVK
ncbi:hypothetical protein MASR1M65_02880 [Saprospiraceae bacterium]